MITLEVIRNHFVNTGFGLSLAEAAEALGISKGSVISDSFKRLEAAGHLVYSTNRKQCIPSDWKELIAEGVKDKLKAEAAAEIERQKALNRQRQKAYQERKRKRK